LLLLRRFQPTFPIDLIPRDNPHGSVPFRNAEPIGALNDFGSMGYAVTFDENDNLYITDLNRARVLICRKALAGRAAE